MKIDRMLKTIAKISGLKTTCIIVALAMTAVPSSYGGELRSEDIIPQDWYQLPEDGTVDAPFLNAFRAGTENPVPVVSRDTQHVGARAQLLDRIFETSSSVLDGMKEVATNNAGSPLALDRPKDWMPWHLDYFVNDLSVSAKGGLGLLTLGGTKTVSVYWRRQNVSSVPFDAATQSAVISQHAENEAALSVTPDSSSEDIAKTIEPIIGAAMAAGKVKDRAVLRRSIEAAALDFQALTVALGRDSGSMWWVSGFRMDFSIDASGRVYTGVTAGGDIRFRFNWSRVMPTSHPRQRASISVTDRISERATNLAKFVRSVEMDLEALAAEPDNKGFRTYGFRVGIGFTGKATIGIMKGGVGVTGHLIFSRAVPKPEVHPEPAPSSASGAVSMIRSEEAALAESGTIAMIERAPIASHLLFAKSRGIPFETIAFTRPSVVDEVVYKIDRARFRAGLTKALRMAEDFAEHAARVHSTKWKIYQLKAGFDMSLTGLLGLVTIGGTATAEIDLYNLNF